LESIEIYPRILPRDTKEVIVFFLGTIFILLILLSPILIIESISRIDKDGIFLTLLTSLFILTYYIIVTIKAFKSITIKIVISPDKIEIVRRFLKSIYYSRNDINAIVKVPTIVGFLTEVGSLFNPFYWSRKVFSGSGLCVISPYRILTKNGDQIFIVPQDDIAFYNLINHKSDKSICQSEESEKRIQDNIIMPRGNLNANNYMQLIKMATPIILYLLVASSILIISFAIKHGIGKSSQVFSPNSPSGVTQAFGQSFMDGGNKWDSAIPLMSFKAAKIVKMYQNIKKDQNIRTDIIQFEIKQEEIRADLARVVVDFVQKIEGDTFEERETYLLIKEENTWKIYGVEKVHNNKVEIINFEDDNLMKQMEEMIKKMGNDNSK